MEIAGVSIKEEYQLVVNQLEADLANSYDILSNFSKAKYQIASFFPDLILSNKLTQKPQFIIEIRRNGDIARCLQQWKSVPYLPAFLFLIVPETDKDNARDIANALGIQIGLYSYRIDGQNVTIDYDQTKNN